MKSLSGKNINLSHINNITDLDAEIRKVKARVRTNEAVIKNNAKKIPVEAVKSTIGSILPTFAKAKIADAAFGTIQTLIGGIIASLLNARSNGTSFKQGVADTFRQIGFFETVKAIFQLFRGKKKKADKNEQS
ncbi:hypothetical protein A9P82_13100 [Arachidicoccus ginsenosidimutans]|uniref:hypothetical protein n=1 Tax=Arachidicoccus sp. BS20 TaxID=1850526 RepID=UPI0007F0667E|nr:hypothetical protein [Arachidicoccus sp. BS20]ANI90139.1 hypothetical protein A9P82_13100 [Arachidicoccus sp. BS20]